MIDLPFPKQLPPQTKIPVPDLPSISDRRDRILAFDIENRPLAYWFDGRTTGEITAIAASWMDSDEVDCRLLTLDPSSGREMVEWFLELYNQADAVSGHYIRKHDLPIVNAACLEMGLPLLGPKLTYDTQADLVARKDLSASQESLAAMYGMPEAKHHMDQTAWRTANRLTPEGLEATRKRVVDDVIQHKALSKRLQQAGALKAPKVWHP